MKLHEVVRGVEEIDKDCSEWEDGHNSLASAEVVVDSHLLEVIRKHIDSDGKLVGGVPRLYNAIATAIESGSIISLKEEGMKIGDFPVRIKKKGKTVGRPSKWEVYASGVMSKIIKTDSYKAESERFITDMYLYGTATFDAKKALGEASDDRG